MARSTGIVLAATGISFANEWINTGTPNYRIGIAGLGFAVLDAGIELISPDAAVGLGWIMLATVILTPFAGKSPIETLGSLATPAVAGTSSVKPAAPFTGAASVR